MRLEDRLLTNRSIDPDTACWLWTGGRTYDGYGKIYVDGKTCIVTRIAYSVFVDSQFDPKLYILHKNYCPNKHCFNPEHIYAGTYEDNKNDRLAAGPYTSGRKLTRELVSLIRVRLSNGDRVGKLAIEYGVSQSMISHIKANREWKAVS